MPCFHRKFRILAETYRLPARTKRAIERRLHQVLVYGLLRNTVHARAKRLIGREMVRRVRRRDVHLNRLCRARAHRG